MARFHALIFSFAIVAMYAASGTSVDAQTKTPASQPASISVSLSFKRMSLRDPPADPEPWAILRVKNLTNHEIAIHDYMYRAHVDGENGEAPTTMVQRQITRRLRPGDTELAEFEMATWTIAPGKSGIHKLELTYLYDLSTPGKYSVYAEVMDPSSIEKSSTPKWVRTNTVKFTMQASDH
jgi:hypothetical protein